MAWIDPISTVVTATSLANEFIKKSGTIRRKVTRIVQKIRHGEIIIPVFGAGGVGKSTAGRILVGNNPLDIAAAYDESWTIEPHELPGDVPGSIFVAPGQLGARADRYWPELISQVNSGKALGIVNVVAYGYHSFMIRSYTEHDLYREGMHVEEFMHIFLQHRRDIELTMLNYLIEKLAPIRKNFYMVTLVSKQDLWWSERNEVRDYYTNGLYGQKIFDLKTNLGDEHFHHEFIPSSLTIANLRTPTGELLAPVCAGYDQFIHLQCLQTLFNKLNDIATAHQVSK